MLQICRSIVSDQIANDLSATCLLVIWPATAEKKKVSKTLRRKAAVLEKAAAVVERCAKMGSSPPASLYGYRAISLSQHFHNH